MAAERNPTPTVDTIIELLDRAHRPIVLVERRNPPQGWALPGGFIDRGESAEAAAWREAYEETGLRIELLGQLGVYSHPERDPRRHTLSVVFIATARGTPQAADDARRTQAFAPWELPARLCFDHDRILHHYWHYRHYGIRPLLTGSP
ncbi:MAG: NUDIX hydrolase [Cyanobacteria bacterium QS_8_64_29]|nr:MAG: NUDIX hydrolase [Cyanobacteria bacterium QS_8_64_29]